MLKLTNSFYRYFTLTCERLDYKAHVKKHASLSCRRERCVDSVAKRQFHSTPSLRKQAKKPRIKIPPLNAQEFDKTEPMSESLQPTGNHVSYGGSFDVSTDEATSGDHWQRDDSSHSSNTDRPCEIPPNFRVWEPVGSQGNSGHGSTFRFKVVSYNVLAQYLLECHPYLYRDCAPRNLKWKVRASRLYDEIVSLDPDILCLQEVQVSHLNDFYSKFEALGYSVIFKQKTGSRQDGCAIYYKQSLFELQDHISVEFYQPDLPILNRDNIGVVVKLVPKGPGSAIVVATTHLLYNPKRTDVRLAQIQVFLAEIDRFAYYSNGKESGHLPIILTGDLNSLPGSAVIQLLDRGHVCASNFRDNSDWERIGVMDNCQHLSVFLNRQEGREADFSTVKIFNSELSAASARSEAATDVKTQFSEYFNSAHIGHSLRLASAYDKYKADGTCEASTYQDFWVTVDYIYFSCCSNLRLTSRLRLPTAAECAALDRLPNEIYASDHLALAASFELTSSSRLASSVIVMFVVAIFISYGLHCYVPVEVVWRRVRARMPAQASPRALRRAETLLRVALCLLTFALAAAVPRLGLFISLFGALCLSALGICFPALMEACLSFPHKGPRARLLKDALLFAVGLVGLLAGTYTALAAIVASLQPTPSPAPSLAPALASTPAPPPTLA